MPNEMTDSLDDIISALNAMYSSKKMIRKADYWARCAGEAANLLRKCCIPDWPIDVGRKIGKWKIVGADYLNRTITLQEVNHE